MAYEITGGEYKVHFLRKEKRVIPNEGKGVPKSCISLVEGPFEEEQESNSTSKPFPLNIPVDEIPEEFEKVSLVEYRILALKSSIYEEALCDYLEIDPKKKRRMGSGKIKEIARKKTNYIMSFSESVLDGLTGRYSLLRTFGKNNHRFLMDGCLGETISYSKCVSELFTRRSITIPFPNISIRLFGDEEVADRVIEESGIKRLEEILPSKFVRSGGISNIVKRGLTYNLDLEGKSIDELINSKNVFL